MEEAKKKRKDDVSESSSSQRPNRFESKSSRSSMEIEKMMHISLKERRKNAKEELAR